MAEAKVLSGAGLRGQVAGQTALSTVGQAGAGLTYRGYDVRELAADAQFEEVAYLLLYGELPTQAELSEYQHQLKALRETLAKAGRICTKSELLRAGVQLLLKESTASTKALVEGLVVVPKGKGAK